MPKSPERTLRPRPCLHSSATFECCDEIEEASIVSGELVVSCGDAAEVFDLAKEALDQIAILVDRGIKGAPLCCRGSAWDDGFCSCRRDSVHGTLAIITLVGQHMTCPQTIEQALDLGDVIAFAARQDEADGIAKRIGGGMNFGAQAAF